MGKGRTPSSEGYDKLNERSHIKRAAKRYLSRGWSVLPLRPRDKRPLIDWTHLQSSRPSEHDLAEWFQRWPDANIGIVTGETSNLVVLDVDPKHGGDETLMRLERRHRPLPITMKAITGGGGSHFYFTHPGFLIRNRAGLAQGIDLRADGGYIVAPPSVHPNGRCYEWAPGCGPEEVDPAPFPRWLAAPLHGVRVGRSISEWRKLVREGVAEGQRNSTIASLTGHLLWHNVDPSIALELMLAWNRARCQPPLDDEEVANVVASIARLHEAGALAGMSRDGA